jgi:hypothetical protein
MENIKPPQPKKVVSVFCKCGDLMLKNYPYSPFNLPLNYKDLLCMKCQYENQKKNNALRK